MFRVVLAGCLQLFCEGKESAMPERLQKIIDLAKIDQTVRAKLRFVPTDHVDKVLDLALIRRGSEEKKAAASIPPVKAERSGVRQ